MENRGGGKGSGKGISKEDAGTKKVSVNLAISTPLMQFPVGSLESIQAKSTAREVREGKEGKSIRAGRAGA